MSHILASVREMLASIFSSLFECLAVDEILVRLRFEARMRILVEGFVIYMLAQFPCSRRGLFRGENYVGRMNASDASFVFLRNFTWIVSAYDSKCRFPHSLFHFGLLFHTLNRFSQSVCSTLLQSCRLLGQGRFLDFIWLLGMVAFPSCAISVVQVT